MFYPENFLRVLGKGKPSHVQLLKLWEDIEFYYANRKLTETPEMTPSIEWLKTTEWYKDGGYKQVRAAAYPSLKDQADMMFHDRQHNTTTCDDAIIAVKTTWANPELQ